MGFGIALTFSALVLLLALAGSGSSSGDGYPSAETTARALCAELEGVPPLAPLAAAEVDLAIRAVVRLQVPGSWPPPRGSSSAQLVYWTRTLELARAVRAGELVCEPVDELDGDELEPEPDGPTEADGRARVCELVGGVLNPVEAYLDAGVLPADQPATLAAAAWALAGGAGPAPPGLVTYAATVLASPATCPMPEMFITINQPRGPGGWVQLEKDVAGRTDELDDLASLADLYPGAKDATGSQRLALMRAINDHPWNRGLHVPAALQWTRDNIGPTVISFNPKWRALPKTTTQRFESGSAYAVAFLPRAKL